MKPKTHPKNYAVKIVCACGHVIDTISTTTDVSITICSHCHPFYTGKQKLIDTAGRVERFKKRYETKAPAEAKKTPA